MENTLVQIINALLIANAKCAELQRDLDAAKAELAKFNAEAPPEPHR